MCFESIDINQYGLLYNTWAMELDTEPRHSGRFWLGLGKDFLHFPKNLEDFEFKSGSDVLIIS